ncbi:MAG: flagellar basal body-associated FliL family protein, partial [Pseudomonadota bacterium]
MPILPILCLLVGGILGAVVAEFVSPPSETMADAEIAATAEGMEGGGEAGDAQALTKGDGAKEAKASTPAAEAGGAREVVTLDRRLIVPVVTDRRSQAVVLMEVAIEIPADLAVDVHNAMPKLRDGLLRVLLTLSASGAFDRGIVDPALMEHVRDLLTERVRMILPAPDATVLLTEALMR